MKIHPNQANSLRFYRALFCSLGFLILGQALVSPAGAADDAWAGLDEPMDESKLAEENEQALDLSPLPEEENAAVEPAVANAAAPTPSGNEAAKPSQEDLIQAEYDAYTRRKQENATEDRMRQAVFHEGSRNTFSLDFSANDFNKFNLGRDSQYGGINYGVGLGYSRVIIRSRYAGRAILGLHAGGVWNREAGKIIFFPVGPRFVYELKFLVGQMLVPIAFVGYDQVFNRVDTAVPTTGVDPVNKENFGSLVYGAGLMVNLNRLDARTGTQALVSTGIRKFNLALLYSLRSGSTDQLSADFFTAGLRFEY